jgi:predicted aldo/keto reductase-like oxidoreductase
VKEYRMKYRKFGKLNWKVSALGFGAMRLPIIGNDASKIDEPEAIRMIRYAIDNGVNYVDTAYPYHRGQSESLVGKALEDGYREKTKLATKMPVWMVKSKQNMDKYFDEQMQRLRVKQIDFYLLHGLGGKSWQKMKKFEVLKWLEKKQDEGKIAHAGFSFHDEYPVFQKIVDSYDRWTFCQIQYNYPDPDYQAGTKGLKYAASKELAVVIMEPIAGGRLALKPPAGIEAIWNKAAVKRTPAEWALQWVWNQPEVSVVLSGMSTMDQVKENVKSADRSGPGVLTSNELQIINEVASKYKEFGFIGCTGCRYCMPCPEGVDIPEIIALYNEYYVKDMDDAIKKKYRKHIRPENQAKKCARCGKCEELCPQKLAIRDVINRAAWIFEQ